MAIDVNDLLDEVMLSGKYYFGSMDYDDAEKLVKESIDAAVGHYKDEDGNVDIDDWSEFDELIEEEIVARMDSTSQPPTN